MCSLPHSRSCQSPTAQRNMKSSGVSPAAPRSLSIRPLARRGTRHSSRCLKIQSGRQIMIMGNNKRSSQTAESPSGVPRPPQLHSLIMSGARGFQPPSRLSVTTLRNDSHPQLPESITPSRHRQLSAAEPLSCPDWAETRQVPQLNGRWPTSC